MSRTLGFTMVLLWVTVLFATTTLQADVPLDPALPEVLWDQADGHLIVKMPDQVIAWLNGEVADTNGRIAVWHDSYLARMATPAFQSGLAAVHTIVKKSLAAHPMSDFEVNEELIPSILRDRTDIAKALSGDGATPLDAGIGCFQSKTGELFCDTMGWFGCVKWGCREDESPITACTIQVEVPCNDSSNIQAPSVGYQHFNLR